MTEKVTIELDDARAVMLEKLREEHGEIVDNTLEEVVSEQLTYLYDRRGDLEPIEVDD